MLMHGDLMEKAENALYKVVQEQAFASELKQLKQKKGLRASSALHKFAPFIDDSGIMRVGGRLQQTGWPFHRQHPILLPKSYLVELFVRQQHIERKHQGVEAMVAFLRQKFWIISARRIIRKVKEGCVVCRRFDANTCEEVVAPLPESRVDHQYPFCVCGLDYAGPLAARTQGDVCKVWIALFSCATTRAVHLEIVTGLSVDEFLLAFRRFVSRRARPRRMISDNAPTFRVAAGIVNMDGSFNQPGSPWFGGFYERLVSSVKAPLRKVLGQALLQC